jgi:hypothetical protein
MTWPKFYELATFVRAKGPHLVRTCVAAMVVADRPGLKRANGEPGCPEERERHALIVDIYVGHPKIPNLSIEAGAHSSPCPALPALALSCHPAARGFED